MSDSSLAFGPQGPLLSGDANFSDAIFNGDVNVTHILDVEVSKAGLPMQSFPAISTVTASLTFTSAQLLTGLIVVSAGTVTGTLPTAADLVAAMITAQLNPVEGDSFKVSIVNTSGNIFTLAAGGATLGQTVTVANNGGATLLVRLTGVDTPAYSVYSV